MGHREFVQALATLPPRGSSMHGQPSRGAADRGEHPGVGRGGNSHGPMDPP